MSSQRMIVSDVHFFLKEGDYNSIEICFQVTFEGITGSSYTGDIAIDQVKITEGSCPGEYICLNIFLQI